MTITTNFAAGDLDYIVKLNAMVSQTNNELAVTAAAAEADKVAAQAAEINAEAAQAAAENASDSAAAAWTAALAANPDLNPVVRMNPSTITVDTAIPAGYNAFSAGPLTIRDDIDVTVSDNANWTIF